MQQLLRILYRLPDSPDVNQFVCDRMVDLEIVAAIIRGSMRGQVEAIHVFTAKPDGSLDAEQIPL